MAAYYLDTSALVKRYAAEVGSAWIRVTTERRAGNALYTSIIAQPETISAFQRKVREGHLNSDRARTLSQRVTVHFTRRYALVAITPSVIAQACELLERYPLRAYDALHLACASAVRAGLQQRQLSAPVFVAADNNLLGAATAEGFVVDNPLQHP